MGSVSLSSQSPAFVEQVSRCAVCGRFSPSGKVIHPKFRTPRSFSFVFPSRFSFTVSAGFTVWLGLFPCFAPCRALTVIARASLFAKDQTSQIGVPRHHHHVSIPLSHIAQPGDFPKMRICRRRFVFQSSRSVIFQSGWRHLCVRFFHVGIFARHWRNPEYRRSAFAVFLRRRQSTTEQTKS